MIVRLRGTLLESYPNRLIVDVNGVGYEVFVPLSSFDQLHPVAGQPIELRTHLHIRENAHTLYGFARDDERDLFLLLIERVSGIGPSMALAILSGMPGETFKQCVVQGDVAGLSKVKGIGKKTAERIILELKDKVGVVDTWKDATSGEVTHVAADAELALLTLGFKQADARKALRMVLDAAPETPSVDQLLRETLRLLQK